MNIEHLVANFDINLDFILFICRYMYKYGFANSDVKI